MIIKYILKKLNPNGSVDRTIDFIGIRCEAIDYACDLHEQFGANYIVAEITETDTFDTRLLKAKDEF